MVSSAVAQGTIASLRHQISKIEGRLVERLDGGLVGPATADEDVDLARRHGLVVPSCELLATGAERFDAALGGGLPGAGLTEIHAAGSRDAGAAAGFALALARLLVDRTTLPFLWIGMAGSFREAGYPYPPGMHFLHGLEASRMLVAQAEKLPDALWIAEQAASLDGFCTILLETRGPSAKLDLTATRRLHRRALDAGHPLFLMRQAAAPEPTAASFRLVVQSAPAGLRSILGKPLARSIGPPAFHLDISKNRTAPPAKFILEWNPHARAFEERAENPVAVVSASQHGAPAAAAAGTLLAFPSPSEPAAAGRQSPGEQHPAHRRTG
jgi:protein ImuA